MTIPPTPWTAEEDGYPGTGEVIDANGASICIIECRSGHPMDPHPEVDGATALIVRSPVMLEALRHIWRSLPEGDPLRETAWFALEPLGGVPPMGNAN